MLRSGRTKDILVSSFTVPLLKFKFNSRPVVSVVDKVYKKIFGWGRTFSNVKFGVLESERKLGHLSSKNGKIQHLKETVLGKVL